MCSFLTCKRTRFSSTHFLRFPGFQPSAGILPASGYSGIRGGARRYMQPRIVPGPGDIQYPIHRHDTTYSAVLIDKAVLQSGSLAKYRAAFFRI